MAAMFVVNIHANDYHIRKVVIVYIVYSILHKVVFHFGIKLHMSSELDGTI